MLYIPPPEKNLDTLRLLGVNLREGQKPPKTWEEYRNLLWSRLMRLAENKSAKADLANVLLNEDLLENEYPEDHELVDLMLFQAGESQKVNTARAYLSSRGKDKASLTRDAEKDAGFAKLSEQAKLKEWKEVNLWEWWNSL